MPDRNRFLLDRVARARGALIGRACGIAHHHGDAIEVDVELVRHDLGERGADAGPEIDPAGEAGDAAVGLDREP